LRALAAPGIEKARWGSGREKRRSAVRPPDDDHISVGDQGKTDAQWVIFTPHGVVTVYNYKNGKNYLGDAGPTVQEITDWHIKAHSPQPYRWACQALELSGIPPASSVVADLPHR